MRVLGSPSRESEASKSGANSQSNPFRNGERGRGGHTFEHSPTLDRPFSLPDILLGTSAFTANGREGSFYPRGMQSHDVRPVNPDEHNRLVANVQTPCSGLAVIDLLPLQLLDDFLSLILDFARY
jgi:hypothetical protein